MNELTVEVNGAQSVPAIVIGNVYPVVWRGSTARASAAHAHSAQVTNLCAVAIGANHRDVHLSVALAAGGRKHRSLRPSHHKAYPGHCRCDDFIVDLVESIRKLPDRR